MINDEAKSELIHHIDELFARIHIDDYVDKVKVCRRNRGFGRRSTK